MSEYNKIHSVFKRDRETNRFIAGQWSKPEFEYLANNTWEWDEKIDGTNIRIEWDGARRVFKGRTDNASIPATLVARLEELFSTERLAVAFGTGDALIVDDVVLYGEGFGKKIQSGGAYMTDRDVDFVLFDVRVGEWWLSRTSVEDIAAKLSLLIAPIVGEGTLAQAINLARVGFQSKFGSAQAEGLVCRPKVQMFSRSGERIIAKVKTRDFKP